MNNVLHKLKKLTQQRFVWISFFAIFQLYSTISLVHTQKHTLVHDHQCQICLSSFNHTPFLLSTNVTIVPLVQKSAAIKQNDLGIIRVHQLTTYNRGPPVINFA